MNAGQTPEHRILQRAEALAEIARWREAISELHRFLRVEPENYRALCRLAQCHYELGEHKAALEHLARAVAAVPDDEWAHRLRSIVYRAQNKNRDALAAAETAVEFAPDEKFALHCLAGAYAALYCYAAAEKVALELREVAPDYDDAHVMLGFIAHRREELAEAETHFRRALELNAQNAEAFNRLGNVVLQRRAPSNSLREWRAMTAEARALLENAVKLDPNNLSYQTDYKAAARSNVYFDVIVYAPGNIFGFVILLCLKISLLFLLALLVGGCVLYIVLLILGLLLKLR